MQKDFRQTVVRSGSRARVDVDQGLRSFMLSVYNYMTVGLIITGFVAWFVGNTPALAQAIWGTPLKWVAMFAPLVFVFFFSSRIQTMSSSTAQGMFWIYSCLMGVSLAFIFLVFTGTSIAKVFFISAGTFAATSLYGYTTKADLTKVGSFLFMGLIGLFLASIVNLFMQSSALEFAISCIGVVIFVGLTAYDTQMLKSMYLDSDSSEIASKKAIMGALNLYLDFINLFMMMLRLLGDRR